MAQDAGWQQDTEPQKSPVQEPTQAAKPPPEPPPGMAAADVWSRCEPATNSHPFITQKQAAGVPVDALRVVPAGDGLRIGGESMVGALVVPVIRPDGATSSLQFITPPDG